MDDNTPPSTLGEYLKTNDIWGSINSIEPFPFINTNISMTDTQAFKYGDRIMFNKAAALDSWVNATNIVDEYSTKWNALINAKINELGLSSDGERVETDTETVNTDSTNVGDTVNKVGAYNTDELIADNGNNTNNNGTIEVVRDKTNKVGNVSYLSLFNNLPLVVKTNIISVAYKDVATYLTLDIY